MSKMPHEQERSHTNIPVRRIIRFLSLGLILCLGVWLLIPPEVPQKKRAGAEGTETEDPPVDVRFDLKFSPGVQYLPGTIPLGIGEPIHALQDVIDEFEEMFPDTNIEVLAVPVALREYLVTQLSSGQAPDIVNVNVEDVWVDVQKGWYVPLDPYLESPNRFVREKGDPDAPGYDQWWDLFKYQAISRGKAAPDGLNYCLSIDMVETGIFYNKDLFAKIGATVPGTWEEFLEILEKSKEAGYIPLLLNLDSLNDWTVDLFFDQIYYGILPGIDLLKDPIREQYLEGYLDWDEITFLFSKGFFTRKDRRYMEMWRLMKEIRPYLNKNLSVVPGAGTDLIREFVTQNAVMIWQSSGMLYRLEADKDLGFEYGIFYLPPFTKKTTKYASGEPMCVIGGVATQLEVTNTAFGDTGDPDTSERLKRVIDFLQFLCLPENCERIVNEYPCFLPNIAGVPVLPPLQPFADFLERRYTTTKWTFTFDLKFTEIQRRMLGLYLNGGIELEEFMEWQEKNIQVSCANILLRKNPDMERLRKSWEELAPVRESMEDLPVE